MPTQSPRHLVIVAALGIACVSGAPPAATQTPAPTTAFSVTAQQGEPPLGAFASQKLAVMPIQFFRADSASPVKSAEWATLRKELDDSIGVAIAARGIGKKWAYAADIVRLSKRNSDYVSDPYSLGAAALRNSKKKVGDPAPSAVVNNVRSLIALGDSRYALIPVDFWFSNTGGVIRPVLHVALVDGRAGQLVWFADVPGDPGPKFSSAEVGAFAQRIADLVAVR